MLACAVDLMTTRFDAFNLIVAVWFIGCNIV